MKKVVLSLGVIFAFVIYSLSQQKPANETIVLPIPSSTAGPTPNKSNPEVPQGKYRDGEYTGKVADAYYGNVQVKAIIQNGKITDVQFLQYPNDRMQSLMRSNMAMPILKSEAIAVQSERVDVVSEATATSQAFVESLGSALVSAKI